MGSAAPLLLPDNLLLSGGKYGNLYLMDRDHLGGYVSGGWHKEECTDSQSVLQTVTVNRGHIHGSPIYWIGPEGKQWVYVMAEAKNLTAFPFVGGRLKTGVDDSENERVEASAPSACHLSQACAQLDAWGYSGALERCESGGYWYRMGLASHEW